MRRFVVGVLAILSVAAGLGAIVLAGVNDDSLVDAIGGFLAHLPFLVIGALLVVRRPGHPLGPVLSAIGVLGSVSAFTDLYAEYGLAPDGEGLPGAALAAWYGEWWWIPWLLLTLVATPLLFPDGRLPSRRWRPLAFGVWVYGGIYTTLAMLQQNLVTLSEDTRVANPVGVRGLDVEAGALAAGILLIHLFAVASAASLFLRYRRVSGREREQIRWMVASVLVVAFMFVGGILWRELLGVMLPLEDAVIAALPIAVGIAILRHRLYDIDRIISRTLTYATVTAMLAGVYLALVTAASLLTPAANSSPIAVAAATLAGAALFRPLRTRVQAVVDRRFNRARYDAAQVVGAYRTHIRSEVDLDTVTRELVDAAHRSVQPAATGLWLRGGTDDPRARLVRVVGTSRE